MEASQHDRRPSKRYRGRSICLGADGAHRGHHHYEIDKKWEDRGFLSRIVPIETYSNFTIACGGQERKVHRIILNAASGYFQTMFRIPCQETISGRLELPDDDPDLVWWMIDYIYYGYVWIHAPPPPDGNLLETCVAMYAMGVKFQVLELREGAEEALKHILVFWYWKLRDLLDMVDAIDELTVDRDGFRSRVWDWLGQHTSVVKRYAGEVMMHWDTGEARFSCRVHWRDLYMGTLGMGRMTGEMRLPKRLRLG